MLIANSQGGSGYVQDGLVLWLDGINKGNVQDKWADLIDGKEFEFTGSFTFNDDNVQFNSAYAKCVENQEFNTLELVFKQNISSWKGLFSANADAKYNICFNSATSLQFGNSINSNAFAVEANKIVRVSVLYNNGYNDLKINNNEPVSATPDRWTGSNAGGVYLGIYYNNRYPFTGNIYSLRLYNRELTDDERTQNYIADVERFGL